MPYWNTANGTTESSGGDPHLAAASALGLVAGAVSCPLFVPFAEHTGYIKVLTQWVLAEAIRQCGAWCSKGLRLRISVNISARDLMNRELPDQIAALSASHNVPAALLGLEITESGFMEDPALLCARPLSLVIASG